MYKILKFIDENEVFFTLVQIAIISISLVLYMFFNLKKETVFIVFSLNGVFFAVCSALHGLETGKIGMFGREVIKKNNELLFYLSLFFHAIAVVLCIYIFLCNFFGIGTENFVISRRIGI